MLIKGGVVLGFGVQNVVSWDEKNDFVIRVELDEDLYDPDDDNSHDTALYNKLKEYPNRFIFELKINKKLEEFKKEYPIAFYDYAKIMEQEKKGRLAKNGYIKFSIIKILKPAPFPLSNLKEQWQKQYLIDSINILHNKLGIIHYDLHPGNVMLMNKHGIPYPVIIDFDSAKIVNLKELSEEEIDEMKDELNTFISDLK